MKVKAYRTDEVECSICGEEDEGITFEFKAFGLFTMSFGVCEGCVSRLFRKFRKKR